MIMTTETLAGPAGAGDASLSFRVEDVTGTFTIDNYRVDRAVSAGVVASSIARQLSMPESVAWTLRSESTGAYLDDRPIGEQLEPGARTVLTAKTHLGGHPPTHRR